MDGNRRWAQRRSQLSTQGYLNGVKAMKRVIAYCIKKNIEYLSLYTFSLENLKRTQEEKKYLFSVLPILLTNLADELRNQNVSVRFVGDRDFFPEEMMDFVLSMESKTAICTGLKLQLLFCYGGQQEVLQAAKSLVEDVQKNGMTTENLTIEKFQDYFWTKGIPNPDVIIRTGGHKRLSNFLLFQAAYAHIYFLDILWPDMSEHEMDAVVLDVEKQVQNFGK